jgi:uncharacterized membrane protein
MEHFSMVSQRAAGSKARVDQCYACHATDSFNNIRKQAGMITIEADWLSAFFRLAVIGLELAGMTILVGAGLATFLFARRARAGDRTEAYSAFRSALGRSILLGLEFLVAGDIVKSLVINPTLDDLIVLAGLVLVRTFLSISLGVEINGHWPWEETGWRGEGACCGGMGRLRRLRPPDAAQRSRDSRWEVHDDRETRIADGRRRPCRRWNAGCAGGAQQHRMEGMAMSMTDCIDDCVASHRMCLETAAWLTKQGGASATASLIAMLNDCAELCQATANSMLRESSLHTILCRACADGCERCARECLSHVVGERIALLGYLQGLRRQLSDDGGHGQLSVLERAQAYWGQAAPARLKRSVGSTMWDRCEAGSYGRESGTG